MNPVDDLTFLDPSAPPPPADSSERAAVRRRGRRRRITRLSLNSSPVVLAVAAAVAIGIAVTGSGSSQATVVPVEPAQLNMTGAAATAPGCPVGQVVEQITRSGVTYTAVDDHDVAPFFAVCVRLPDGTVFHQVQYGNGFTPFPDGSYLAVDALGHVFANLAPGNIEGVLVLVPGRDSVKVLGIYTASVDRSTPTFTLSIMRRICAPSCASGKELHFRAVWDPGTDTYVLRDSPLNFMLGTTTVPPLPTAPDPEHSGTSLAPETYRTANGTVLYPVMLIDGVTDGRIRWTVTTGTRPFPVQVSDFTLFASCTLTRGVDGHVVAAHTTYRLELSCPSSFDGATVSVFYAPAGKALARWTNGV